MAPDPREARHLSGRYRTGSGRTVEPAERLAAGAAGTAVAVRGQADVVLKLLDTPSADDERRIKAMLSLNVPLRVPGAAAVIAWPTDLVFDQSGNYAGFLMPRAPEPKPVTLGTLALRRERETRLNENLGWDALLKIITNYSAAVAALHACSVVVCDINLKNAMVSGDLTVTVIDCDSTQIEAGGRVYLSSYYQEEFLAPELKGGVALRERPRSETSDRWSLAVLIWMTLMDGHHPFDGRWLGSGEPERDDHIAVGRFPHSPNVHDLAPSQEAPPWRALPPELQRLFLEAFTVGARNPSKRPSALQWADALRVSATRLKRCNGATGRYHRFPAGERDCPWCEYETYLRAGLPTASIPTGQKGRGAPSRPARPRATPRPSPSVPPAPEPTRPPSSPIPSFAAGRTLALGTLAVFLVAIVVAIAQSGGTEGSSDSASAGLSGSGSESGGGDNGSAAAAQRRAVRWAPARAARSHYVALGNGAYRRAFGFMAPSYRRKNPRWLEQVQESQPRINVVSVGKPRIRGGTAWVPALFFARDTRDTVRSDTVCRRFEGPMHMIETYEGWRYDPTEDFAVKEKPYGASGCP